MEYITDNHERFPQNVLEPKKVMNIFTLYTFKFKGLYDLYNYLKGNPQINRRVWSENYLASVDNGFSFAGKPYDEAVEDLIGDVDSEYEEFLKIEKRMRSYGRDVRKYEQIRSVAGGHVNVPLYTAGGPLIYESSRIVSKPKFININIALSYSSDTLRTAVYNRAVIITNLIMALEKEGYAVNVNAFELTKQSDELFQIILDIKNYGGKVNYPALYKSLCNVEFLRRICFRLLETSDVKREWNIGYGTTCSSDFINKIFKLNKTDIYFPQPYDLEIYGKDICLDFEKAITHLKLGDVIDVERETNNIRDGVKILKR